MTTKKPDLEALHHIADDCIAIADAWDAIGGNAADPADDLRELAERIRAALPQKLPAPGFYRVEASDGIVFYCVVHSFDGQLTAVGPSFRSLWDALDAVSWERLNRMGGAP